jgi:integrase/recombinase XerD
MIPKYLKHMRAVGRSAYTIRGARFILKRVAKSLAEKEIFHIEDLDYEVLEEYQQDLAFSFTNRGNPLSIRTQVKILGTIKCFTRYLKERDYLVTDPGHRIKLPKEPLCLPKSILSSKEIERLMNACDMQTITGYRDRVLLEILYDTAVRRLELSLMKLIDLDLTTGYIKVTGKGNKERVVPISTRVCGLVNNYILLIRPSLTSDPDNDWLFINDVGGQMKTHTIWRIIKKYAALAALKKNVTTHTFRHTCVTHMLKNGAPIRHLQEMLGHASLESTQVYTRVTINDLKKVHSKYHPGES